MSLILEHVSEDKKPSHEESEHHSDSDSESKEGSTTSEEDTFLSIWYPSLPNFPTPYDKALKYITKNFNCETVIKGLSHSLISHSTHSIITHLLTLLVINSNIICIDKSIYNCNALLQKWLELQARYFLSDKINPFIIQCIL